MIALESPRSTLVCAVLLALAAAAVFLNNGSGAMLNHDNAIYAYGGQEMLRGVSPYVSIFDHKGPLAPILCGLGGWLGERAGGDTFLAMRRLFLVLGVLGVVGTFGMTRALLGSTRAGLLAAALLLACARFSYYCAAGPEAKVAMLAFQTCALWALARGRWFLGGALGALCGLVWQPTAIFAFAALFLAAAGAPAGARLRGFATAATGMLLPLALCALYFASHGALGALFEGAVWFNVAYRESTGTLGHRLYEMGEAIYLSNTGLGPQIVLGLLAVPLLCLVGARRGGWRHALTRAPRAGLLLTFPWPFAWSALDYQGFDDFLVFLPYAAVGFAWLLDRGLCSVAEELELRPRARCALWAASLAAFLGAGVFVERFYRAEQLDAQRSEVAALFAAAPAEARWVSIGAQQALVLGGRRNSTRYGFLMRGIDRLIEATEPGGFQGWLESLGAPEGGVLVGRIALNSISPEHRATLEKWLKRFELDKQASRSWLVYRPRPGS